MANWLQAEYRDFHGYPRAMLCTNARGTYYFWSRFDADRDRHAEVYEVYCIRPFTGSETCESWFGLETRALERLADLPVDEFPFDLKRRQFLPYDPIEYLLAGGHD
jgi:hypothetical protein